MRALGADIEAVPHSLLKSAIGALIGVFTRRPIQVSLYRSGRLGRRLAEIASAFDPDVIYFHFIRSAQYIEYVSSVKPVKVLDFTDAVSLYLSRFVETERNPVSRWLIKMERDRIAAYERIAEKYDASFICSTLDRDYLLGKGIRADFHILPNGVDTELFKGTRRTPDKRRVIFTGNMPYFPNEDAVLYFVSTIFPRVLREVPDAKLFVVGRCPTRKVRSLASENIIVTGFVDNIVTEYLKSAVAIAPTRFGAGTLNKVIEPIVLGVPVVATSIAVRGLPSAAQRFVHVADSPDDFGNGLVEILKQESLEGGLSENGLESVRHSLSWERIVADFEEDLRKIVDGSASHNRQDNRL